MSRSCVVIDIILSSLGCHLGFPTRRQHCSGSSANTFPAIIRLTTRHIRTSTTIHNYDNIKARHVHSSLLHVGLSNTRRLPLSNLRIMIHIVGSSFRSNLLLPTSRQSTSDILPHQCEKTELHKNKPLTLEDLSVSIEGRAPADVGAVLYAAESAKYFTLLNKDCKYYTQLEVCQHTSSWAFVLRLGNSVWL